MTDRPAASALEVAVWFVRDLRSEGLDLGPADTEVLVRSLEAIDTVDPRQVYWTGRATLVRRPGDVPVYDSAFRRWWGDGLVAPAARHPVGGPTGEPVEQAMEGGGSIGGVVASAAEVLADRDFARCTDGERRQLERLVARIPLTAPRRRSRRTRPSRRGRGPVDFERTARQMLTSMGEPLHTWHRHRRPQPRPVVLVLDVSGSMAAYARPLLRFAHAWVRSDAPTEVFAVGTRLTRLTSRLDVGDPDRALAAAADEVEDWSGGTRLGESLDQFCRRWGAPGLAHGAVVVVVSDGWERGDPAVLAAATRRLRALAHRLVWVNPHKASPGYEPLARGMAAALPHVDHFVSGHSLSALEELSTVITRGTCEAAAPRPVIPDQGERTSGRIVR